MHSDRTVRCTRQHVRVLRTLTHAHPYQRPSPEKVFQMMTAELRQLDLRIHRLRRQGHRFFRPSHVPDRFPDQILLRPEVPEQRHLIHASDLSDAPRAKVERGQPRARIGDEGPMGRILVRGEPGHDIIPELAPLPGEPVIDKPGKGSFYATDFDMLLRQRGIRNIVLCGLTTDVCVHTTMREANDRGYECLLLGDCCAATDPGNHAAALKMVTMQNGVFGALSTSAALLEALP